MRFHPFFYFTYLNFIKYLISFNKNLYLTINIAIIINTLSFSTFLGDKIYYSYFWSCLYFFFFFFFLSFCAFAFYFYCYYYSFCIYYSFFYNYRICSSNLLLLLCNILIYFHFKYKINWSCLN